MVKLFPINRQSSQSGHTLTELLVTLLILSILLLLPIIFLPNSWNSYKTEEVAKQFKEDLLLAQHLAMAHGRTIEVSINQTGKEYIIRGTSNDILLRRSFMDETMIFHSSSLPLTNIRFLYNGNPMYSGTMLLEVGGHTYRFTILLGKGRVDYRKF
ncbi:competence type IV pilus minor pilin ComGD [Alkalihalophilus lindianensis]|uniref:Competence type IV pilus minor pilin ComGD n=1 Tax=Alkalihalophilus lindianensis TaxID=1630542 RepID=A0ABU3XCF1_9BACI|nr:competence type IV pilus minor pilin ComGD [Alkalihalophilus lindianensis]MDV2685109.1 competence type IV pilus minor pilin ComGD [Alkalihalophilus lindianensis]